MPCHVWINDYSTENNNFNYSKAIEEGFCNNILNVRGIVFVINDNLPDNYIIKTSNGLKTEYESVSHFRYSLMETLPFKPFFSMDNSIKCNIDVCYDILDVLREIYSYAM
jgi:hypothetical protein